MLRTFLSLIFVTVLVACGPSGHRRPDGSPNPNPNPNPNPTPNPNVEYVDVTLNLTVESPTSISADVSYTLTYKSINETGTASLVSNKASIVAHKVPMDNKLADLTVSAIYNKNEFKFYDKVALTKQPYAITLRFNGMKFGDLRVNIPANWKMFQKAANGGDLLILNLKVATDETVTILEKNQTGIGFTTIFTADAKVEKPQETKDINGIKWTTIGISKSSNYSYGFLAEVNGKTYFGYSKAKSLDKAIANGESFLKGISAKILLGSLTDEDFKGKKYYIGFGDKLDGEMGNEVLYDVKHTQDIFTKQVGGDYIGQTFVNENANAEKLRQGWKDLGSKIKPEDMYVQYSSGHGYNGGLAFGVTMDEIRDNALSYGTKETIIFLMACESGSLVDSFNAKKDQWSNFEEEGKTILAFASSKTSENSSTGPITDPDEPNGPEGSAGSAYGHSLWKALIGYSDGYNDGIKDGFISIDEILQFTIWKTQQVGGHTPVYTGSYNPALIMNRIPPKAWLDSLEGGTDGMTDEQIMEKIKELDAAMSVQ